MKRKVTIMLLATAAVVGGLVATTGSANADPVTDIVNMLLHLGKPSW